MILGINGILASSILNQLLLLDIYPNAAAAYSLRKLRNAYAGNAIRVRRSSDNTEQNIGFVNNVLDTTSLLSFCGVGNGFITTWYDQSGNAKDATQTTASNQPQIVLNGAMITTGGKNSIKFDGTNDRLDASTLTTGNPKSIFVATKNDYLGFIERVLFDSVTTSQAIFYKRGDDKIEIAFGVAAGSNYTMTTNFVLYSVMHNGASSNAFVNSTTQFYTNANWGTNAFNGLRIAATRGNAPTLFYIGNISEFIVYASDESTNRTGIEGNINSFYSIY